jgi:hypothetical protein
MTQATGQRKFTLSAAKGSGGAVGLDGMPSDPPQPATSITWAATATLLIRDRVLSGIVRPIALRTPINSGSTDRQCRDCRQYNPVAASPFVSRFVGLLRIPERRRR